jgi:hypothetical protein
VEWCPAHQGGVHKDLTRPVAQESALIPFVTDFVSNLRVQQTQCLASLSLIFV